MSTYAQWKPEVIALLNEKNGSALTVDDIELELLNQDDASVTVKVTPSESGRYYGEETITYVRRDLAKAFLNIPIRIIVASDTTVGALLERVAERFGISFDAAVDFAQEALDKAVSFAESGQQQVEIPAADSSFVWVGKITLTAANDGLDLESIIANINLTELKYVTITEPDSTSAAFQTFPVDYTGVTGLSALAVGSTLSEAQADAIVQRTQESEEVNSPTDLRTALNGAEVSAVTDGGATKIATVTVLPQPTYSGNAYLTYAAQAAKTFQSVMDEYGPGRAVVVNVTSSSTDTQFPISGINDEDAACKQLLDFKIDAYTAMVVPALLKTINAVGEFGLSDDDIAAVAASVTAEVTTDIVVGTNVRTLRFSETRGRDDLQVLIIRYENKLTIFSETGAVSGVRKTVADTDNQNHNQIMSNIVSGLMNKHTDGVMSDADVVALVSGTVQSNPILVGSVAAPDDYTGWTTLRSIKSDFEQAQFPGKYKKETAIFISPNADQLSLVIRGTDYADDFEYRIADNYQLVFPISTTTDQSLMRFKGDDTSTKLLTALDNTIVPIYGAASMVGKSILAALVGITCSDVGENNQVTISIDGYPTLKLSATIVLPSVADAIAAEYDTMDKFLAAIFATGTTGPVVTASELFTLDDRYLSANTSPEAGVNSTDYIWKKIMALQAYGFDEGFITPESVQVSKSSRGVSFNFAVGGLSQARLGLEASTQVAFNLYSQLSSGDLMQFQTFTTGNGTTANNPTYVGISPTDAIGNFIAEVLKGTVTQGRFDAVIPAIKGKFGGDVINNSESGPNFADLTKGTAVDVTSTMPDSAYNWQKYISKVEIIPYVDENNIILTFKPTIRAEFEQDVTPGFIGIPNVETGPFWTLRNATSQSSNISFEELLVSEESQTMVDTSALDWTSVGLVAGVRMDNTGLTVTQLGSSAYANCVNSQHFPGHETPWHIGGTRV